LLALHQKESFVTKELWKKKKKKTREREREK
jgi:hypothetical protein